MGRPQILGRETCPKCGKLGRTRKKNVRSRMGGRYVDRSYFHHNDKSIPEHYVDNYTRFASWEYEKHPLGKTLKAIDALTIDPSNRLQRKVEKLEIEKSQYDKLAEQIRRLEKRIDK